MTSTANLFDEPDSFSLIELIGGHEFNFNDECETPTLLSHSPYFENDNFIKLMQEKSHTFNILSLNCQSINAKFNELKMYLDLYSRSNLSISAICLQETWLSGDSDLSLLEVENYNFISKAKHCSAHGGVAIYLHKSFNYAVLPLDNSEFWDGLFVEVTANGSNSLANKKKVVLGNVYRPPRCGSECIENFITETSRVFETLQRHKNVVIAGDYNLDLLKFKENRGINNYFEHLLSNGYIPKISFPTRLTHRRGTLIDNFLVKISDNFSKTTSGIILNDISDHLPYFVCLDYLSCRKEPSKFVKVKSQCSQDFLNYLRNIDVMTSLDTSPNANPDKNYEAFKKILDNGINKYFPVKILKFDKYKHRKCPWVTKGILVAIKRRDSMYVKLKSMSQDHHMYNTNKTNLQTYNRILRNSIRTAKRLYYHKMFEKYKNDMKNTWVIIKEMINKSKKGKDPAKSFLINGESVTDSELIANNFNSFFTGLGPNLASKILSPSNKTYTDFLLQHVNSSFKFSHVNRDAVLKVIDGLKSKSSYGNDRISNKLLKIVKHELADALTLIFNQCISQNTFPYALKIAKVIPIYKKNEEYIMDNYRPVSVLPSISKVFEKLLYKQIYEYFCENDLLYTSQYGFRPMHSTELAALEFVDRILFDLDKGEIPISIFLDLSKAFDTIDHEILIRKLQFYGFEELSLQLVRSYLNDRQQYVEFGNVQSQCLRVTTGVPQGSVLGPLFFIIYVNDICKASGLFQPIIYADDTTLTATLSTFRKEDCSIDDTINKELNQICNWMKLNKLSLNCSKTKAMLFHMPQKTVQYPKLVIDNVDIDFVESFNFLGIVIDQNLSWIQHITLISKKISKCVGILNRLKHAVPSNILKNIYNALVLPYLNYGALLWHKCAGRLLVLQKKAIRAISNSKYNAHTGILFRNLGLLTCTDIGALQCFVFCFKLENNLLPKYFLECNIFIRHSAVHSYSTRGLENYALPVIKHEFAKCSIRYKIAIFFNEMTFEFKTKIYTHSINGFKVYVKKKIIEKYETVCIDPNCYSCR